MSIEIKKTGICKDCPYMDLKVDPYETTDGRGYTYIAMDVDCEHWDACCRAYEKGGRVAYGAERMDEVTE